MQEIKAIIFDFGGVFSTRDELGDIGGRLAKRYQVSRRLVDDMTFHAWLKARVDPRADAAFWKALARALGISVSALKRDYLRYPRSAPGMRDFVRALRRRYIVGMLTNQMKTWHRLLMRQWKLTGLFHPMVTSYEEGIAKPDPRIYRRLLRTLRVPAGACIYVDDRVENLAPAIMLGMHAIHFKNPKQLMRELRRRGVAW